MNQYYDRKRTGSNDGFSDRADPRVVPFGRHLTCASESPVVLVCDVTRSVQHIPHILFDQMPKIAHELAFHGYLVEPLVSLAAVGDITCDEMPLQITDFQPIRSLDASFEHIWLEGGGGAPGWQESYEFAAYFYARRTSFPHAKMPFCFFIGDEGFYETLEAAKLSRHFGGVHTDTTAIRMFAELKERFQGNVFFIHRYYSGGHDAEIVAQWKDVLGVEKIIDLRTDSIIGDLILGAIALATGMRTLSTYLDDMRQRNESSSRIDIVGQSLNVLVPASEQIEFHPNPHPQGRLAQSKHVEPTTPPKNKGSKKRGVQKEEDPWRL